MREERHLLHGSCGFRFASPAGARLRAEGSARSGTRRRTLEAFTFRSDRTGRRVLSSEPVMWARRPTAGPALSTSESSPPGEGAGRSRLLYGLGLFALLLAVYMGNAYTTGNNDATGNVRLPLQVLEHGRLTFTPEDSPFMFTWRLRLRDREVPARFRSWNQRAGGETLRSYQQRGALGAPRPMYYLVPTREPGVYANTFGVGAGLLALPVLAAVKPFTSSFDEDATVLWRVGKLAAAAAVAGSAVFLFLAALLHLSLRASLALALLYGLGTCAWSVSSQILLQHGPAELFLAMGTYLLLKKTSSSIVLAGLAYSAAVACRPTCVLVVAVVAAWLAIGKRPALLRFCLGALPIGLLLAGYGWYTFGDPLATGQLLVGPKVALTKTGAPGLWQTPLYVGAAGLLLSPARGLLVYSPVVLVGLWGMGRVWRGRKWVELRPLSLAAVALFLPAAKRFDWWGGWSYGYRPIMETVTLLAFLAIPMVAWVGARRWRLAAVGVLAVWSLGTQAVGALAYDVRGWNGRRVYDVVNDMRERRATYDDRMSAEQHGGGGGGHVQSRELNVDWPQYRYRLWSLRDNPIRYYLENWSRIRARRQQDAIRFMHEDG